MIYLLVFLYTLLQIIFTPVAIVYMLFRYRKRAQFLSLLKTKLFPSRITLPRPEKARVWLHAVSVGEVAACKSVIKELLRTTSIELVISTSTATGLKQAKEIFPEASLHFLLPIDYPWNVLSLFSYLRPSLLLLGESDFWVNLLASAHFLHIPIVLLNGKLSARSAKRFSQIAPISRLLFSLIDHYFVQDALHAQRFTQFVDENKITISGNCKLDVCPAIPSEKWHKECKSKGLIRDEEFVVVAGSTHEGEEKFLLQQLHLLKRQIPLKLVLVPRHPERFSAVKEFLEKEGICYSATSSKGIADQNVQVVLVDQMGSLGFWYSLAHIAVVCGSFTSKVGGHNLVEPHYFHVPILYGPYVFSQLNLDSLVKQYKSGIQVSQDTFAPILAELYKYPEKREALCQGAKQLIASHKGISKGVAEKIAKKYGNILALNSSAC